MRRPNTPALELVPALAEAQVKDDDSVSHGPYEDLDAFPGTIVVNVYVRGKRIGRWESLATDWDDELADALEALVVRRTPSLEMVR